MSIADQSQPKHSADGWVSVSGRIASTHPCVSSHIKLTGIQRLVFVSRSGRMLHVIVRISPWTGRVFQVHLCGVRRSHFSLFLTSNKSQQRTSVLLNDR